MPNSARLEDSRLYFLHLFARLNPGVTPAQAKSDLDRIVAPILAEERKELKINSAKIIDRFLAKRFTLYPASHGNLSNQQDIETAMWLLSALVAGVLLIACANVANLLLARSTARRKEIAVRLALGASRGQLIRLVLTESLLLALLGGLIGLLAANWASDALLLFANPSGSQSLPLETTPGPRIVLFTFALSLLTALLFGLAPALAASRADVAPTLKDEAGALSNVASSAWLRKGLVVFQVALSLLLLAAASLFLTTLHNLRNNNPGFDTSHLITFSVSPALNGYDMPKSIALLDRLTAALEALPAVNEVSMAAEPLLANSQSQSTMSVEGYQPTPEEDMNPLVNEIGPGFIHTMRIPLLQGRDFTPADRNGAPKVAIISETFAKMYFKGRDPIGFKIGFRRESSPDRTIVGVIREVHHRDLRDDRTKRQVYFPSSQARSIESRTFYLRTSAPLDSLAPAIRTLVRKEDPALAIANLRTMQDQIDIALTLERVISVLCTAFGVIATLLAAIGLYGVMAYHVLRRTREIGIRMALGAQRADVHRLVLKEAAYLAAGGVLLGIPLALAFSRYTKTLLFGIEPANPLTYAGTAAFLLAVALTASLIPARRASRIDPLTSLRH
jgi:predicted permease